MRTDTSYNKNELISSLRQFCQRHLESVFNIFFENASTALLGMAEAAETNRLQTLYVDAQRLIRGRRGEIETSVTEAVLASFAALDPNAANNTSEVRETSTRNTPYNHFELLGNEDLEVMIALDNGTTQALETFKKPLYMLQRRFDTLSDGAAIKLMPMSPDSVMEAFADGVSDGMIAVEVQVVLINLFNKACFGRDYGELLIQANEFLEESGMFPASDPAKSASEQSMAKPEIVLEAKATDQPVTSEGDIEQRLEELVNTLSLGVMPTITSGISPEASPDASAEISPNDSAYSPPVFTAPPVEPPTSRIQTELLARISTILESTGQRLAGTDAVYLGRPQVVAEIDKHISQLQQSYKKGQSEHLVCGQMTRQLEQTINAAHPLGKQGLHRNDASVFQVVGNAFSRFGEGNGMAPDAQQAISRCELPLLKLALNKPSILEQENHPIRRLFNEMANYAIGLEQGNCSGNKIYQQMLKLSETMLSDGFGEQQIPQMLTGFMAAVDADRRVTRLQEKRQLEEIAAQEKVNWAHTRVDREISDRVVGHELPVAILNFAEQHWCKVLHIAHLRSGESSIEWQQGLEILDRLLEIVGFEASTRSKTAVARLLNDIKLRLEHISIDALQLADQMDRLQFILTPARPANVTDIGSKTKGKAPSKTNVKDPTEGEFADQIKRIMISRLQTEMPGENIAETINKVESLDDQSQQSLSEVQKGCWIELCDDIKSRKRGKLAGIVGPSWKYVFVNNKGKLVAELNRARLALEMKEGKVTVLDNSHLFDKAIKAAIDDIKGLSVAS